MLRYACVGVTPGLSRAADDLWRHTLSNIRTTFGRLEYLASLRNVHTGRYEHFGLEQRFDAERSNLTLRRSHESVFAAWLAMNLELQKNDFDDYLSDLEAQPKEVLATWMHLQPFATWVPASTLFEERSLFLSDLDILLAASCREWGVVLPTA